MNFYQWLQTLDPNKNWSSTSIAEIEKQVVETVKETGFINIRGVIGQFFLNDDLGFPDNFLAYNGEEF